MPTQGFYDLVGGDYATARRTIETLAALPTCHLEVTTLVIPGLNDDPAAVEETARWLASLDPGITYHLTRFFPQHRMTDRPPTPIATLRRLADAARRHLNDVLLGNCSAPTRRRRSGRRAGGGSRFAKRGFGV